MSSTVRAGGMTPTNDHAAEERLPSGATVRLTTGQALVRYLGAQFSERDGVRRPVIPAVFGIFGHGNAAGVGQALAAREGGVRYLQGKNEQAMVHAAIGFAKQHDRLSTLAVTTSIGPGATNLVTGAATATINRIPVLLLPGDVFARRRQGPVLQQLEDFQSFDVTANDSLRSVSRYFDRIQRPEQLVESLPHAISTLLDPADTGAVTLALCQDVQAEAFDFPASLFRERVHRVFRTPPPADAISAAVERIAASRRPLLVCGGGVRYSGAQAALRDFSAAFGAPVGETLAGRGCTAGAELCAGGLGFIGSPAANALARNADLVVAIGSRLTDVVTGSHSLFADPDVEFLNINVARFDAVKLGGLQLVSDARLTIEAIDDALKPRGWTADSSWQAMARDAIARWSGDVATELARGHDMLTGPGVIEELAAFTHVTDRVVLSSSTAIGHAHAFWDHGHAAALDMEYGFSCMGHEIPAAMGARIAGVAGEVYAVIGDGTYLMGNTGDLVTAVQEGLRVTVVVLVNDGYQCIRGFQEGAVGSEFGTQFRRRRPGIANYDGEVATIDYAANAVSLGCRAASCATRDELRDALEAAKAADGPFLIAAHVTSDAFDVPAGAWWDYGSPEVGDDPRLTRRHEEYLAQQAEQRWYA